MTAAAVPAAKVRASSIHFKLIPNISQSIAHVLREQKIEPSYLLTEELRLENRTIFTASDDLHALFQQDQNRRTKRAKTEQLCSWWEAVINLPAPTHPIDQYYEKLNNQFKKWHIDFEKLTGQSVRHIEVHLDEGHIDKKNKVVYNAHAHILVCRLSNDPENASVQRQGRARLSQVQDISADSLEMPRGETLADRGGKRGRKHIPARMYALMQEALKEQEIEHDRQIDLLNFEIAELNHEIQIQEHFSKLELKQAHEALHSAQQLGQAQQKELEDGVRITKQQMTDLLADAHKTGFQTAAAQNDYKFLRGFFKASQRATQRDYQVLKRMNALKIDLSVLVNRAESDAGLVFEPVRLLSKVFAEISEEHHFEIACAVLNYDQKRFAEHNIEIETESQKSAERDHGFDF